MTKEEAIRASGYATENELIVVALKMAANSARSWRYSCDDEESYDHYNSLMIAWEAMIDERSADN